MLISRNLKRVRLKTIHCVQRNHHDRSVAFLRHRTCHIRTKPIFGIDTLNELRFEPQKAKATRADPQVILRVAKQSTTEFRNAGARQFESSDHSVGSEPPELSPAHAHP